MRYIFKWFLQIVSILFQFHWSFQWYWWMLIKKKNYPLTCNFITFQKLGFSFGHFEIIFQDAKKKKEKNRFPITGWDLNKLIMITFFWRHWIQPFLNFNDSRDSCNKAESNKWLREWNNCSMCQLSGLMLLMSTEYLSVPCLCGIFSK